MVYGHVSSLIVLCHDLAKHFEAHVHIPLNLVGSEEAEEKLFGCAAASFRGKKIQK